MKARFHVDDAFPFEDALRVSWDPSLVRTPRVLVPIVVDALVATGQEQSWADCRMQAPSKAAKGQAPTDARSLLPDPFDDLPDPRPAGVHLHWALPDGLTRGTVGAAASGTDVSLPAVPDRWLVLRLSDGPDPRRRAVAGWVLEAGGPAPNVVALDKWRGPGPTGGVERPMTAMGHGDPAWAAYYDNVTNRLAFHDAADGVSGPVAYLVCGWYADPHLDPLGTNITSLAAFEQALEGLGWSLQGRLQKSGAKARMRVRKAAARGLGAKDKAWADHTPRRDADGNFVTSGDWWPSSTLFHGAAVDIALNGARAGGPPAAESLRVAFGATGGEALAALLAAAGAGADEERVVEALQLGVLHELDQPDGRARLDALLHAGTFGSLSGGPDETERIWEPPVPAQPDPPATPRTPDAGAFANRRSSGLGGVGGVLGEGLINADIVEARGEAGPLSGVGSHKVVGAKAMVGHLYDVLAGLSVEGVLGDRVPPGPSPRPGRWVEVKRPQPRFHHPVDPVVLVQGGKRSFKHGGDGRLSDDDKLPCRLSGFTVTAISADLGGSRPAHGTLTGGRLLERGVDNGGVPAECTDLLHEAVLLDPGSAGAAIAQLLGGGSGRGRTGPDRLQAAKVSQNWQVEQTAWWVLNDPRVDPAPVLTRSGVTGTLPSPIAITPPHQPWNPLHLDWEVAFTPSANGIADWELGEVDFEPADSDGEGEEEALSEPVVLRGRALVTPGPVRTLAEAAQAAIDAAARSGGAGVLPPRVKTQHLSIVAKALFEHFAETSTRAADVVREAGDARADLSSIVELLDRMDVLGGALDGFNLGLRKDAAAVRPLLPDGTPDATPITAPAGFMSMRAGTLRVTRLRLVDGFGQYVDLAGSAGTESIVLGESVRNDDTPGQAVLTPRFTAPSRLLLRWADAASDSIGPGLNPVCGFVLPDHLDGGLEFFAADGTNLGNLRADDHLDRLGSLLWEDAPGSPTTVGRPPRVDVANRFLRGIADGLLDWGMSDHGTRPGGSATEEGALAALLRVVDSTMWTVDPFGHAGDEHLALLVGHPVVVMRAVLRLETADPADPPELAWTPVPVRLGALTHWQDGLLAFYVNDDYGTVHCAPAAASMAREVGARRGFLQQAPAVPGFYENFEADLAGRADAGDSPVSHPYVAPEDVIMVRPNQDVRLTMLVEPHTLVHATTGVLPRKDIGMRREWMATALASLAPTFRFGPILRDPDTLRMPIATDIAGTWTWNYKADVARWVEEQILNASHDAFLDDTPAEGTEGWLRLTPPPSPPPAPSGGPA